MSARLDSPASTRQWLLAETPSSRLQARLGEAYLAWRAFRTNPLAMVGLGIVDAQVEGAMNHRDRGRVVALAVRAGHRHAAEADLRHLQPASPEQPVLHGWVPRVRVEGGKFSLLNLAK